MTETRSATVEQVAGRTITFTGDLRERDIVGWPCGSGRVARVDGDTALIFPHGSDTARLRQGDVLSVLAESVPGR